jgi:RNA-dependent RNA polymerase
MCKLFLGDLTDVVVSRIKSAIISGITVNGKKYEFLAYSSSQLKEFSLWMVCPQNGWTAESMRASMGDFSGCNTPSKYAARIGQCFSTTFQGLAGQDTTLLESQQPSLRHRVVNDILSQDKTMVHSDGCGLISTGAMSMLLEILPHRTKDVVENTSVVQVRYGGAKGILVSWDTSVLKDVIQKPNLWFDLLLRHSMVKFSAPFNFLEICR